MGTHHPEHHIKWGVGLFPDPDLHACLQGLGEIFGLLEGLGESHPCLVGQTCPEPYLPQFWSDLGFVFRF